MCSSTLLYLLLLFISFPFLSSLLEGWKGLNPSLSRLHQVKPTDVIHCDLTAESVCYECSALHAAPFECAAAVFSVKGISFDFSLCNHTINTQRVYEIHCDT